MMNKHNPPVVIVLLPLIGSFIGRIIGRVIDIQGDFLLGLSWLGTIELAGLLIGTAIAGILLYRHRKAISE
jgi:hypothetical protein